MFCCLVTGGKPCRPERQKTQHLKAGLHASATARPKPLQISGTFKARTDSSRGEEIDDQWQMFAPKVELPNKSAGLLQVVCQRAKQDAAVSKFGDNWRLNQSARV